MFFGFGASGLGPGLDNNHLRAASPGDLLVPRAGTLASDDFLFCSFFNFVAASSLRVLKVDHIHNNQDISRNLVGS